MVNEDTASAQPAAEQGSSAGQGKTTEFALAIQVRDVRGKSEARRVRKAGMLPAVVYSRGDKAKSITLSQKDFVRLAEKAKTTQKFLLVSDEKSLDKKEVIVKDIQLSGQTGRVLHADFQLLDNETPVAVDVPVTVTGEAPGVKIQGGVLTTQCREITILSLPKDIPSQIVVSVSELKLGERIRTRDIELPDGVRLKSNPEETVANVISGRAAKLSESEEAASEAAPAESSPAAAK